MNDDIVDAAESGVCQLCVEDLSTHSPDEWIYRSQIDDWAGNSDQGSIAVVWCDGSVCVGQGRDAVGERIAIMTGVFRSNYSGHCLEYLILPGWSRDTRRQEVVSEMLCRWRWD